MTAQDSNHASPPENTQKFAGWRMTGIAFFLDFIQVGFFFYSFGIFFLALTEEFGATRLGVSLAFMISSIVGAIFGPFIGQLLDKQSSIKPTMIAGALMLATGYGLLSQITAMWQFYFIAGTLLALGGSTMGGQSSSKLVANWFVKKRGVALGVATMGISGSGVLMPALSSFMIDEYGWRNSYLLFAISIIILVIPVILIWVVTKPEDIGQLPDGEIIAPNAPVAAVVPQTQWTTSAILKSTNFWLIALTFSILIGVFQAILLHMVPQFMDMGFDIEEAAFALSVAATLGVLGKVVFGWLIDNFHPRLAVWVCIATQAAGALGILLFDDYTLLLSASALYGFGMGGVVPLNGAISGAVFGRLSFGRVMGLMRPATLPIQGATTPLAGWIYDQTGSYLYAFEIFFGAWLVAAIAISLVKLPNSEQASNS
ncbi:MAG: MFS transporter [Pseudomonadales bacterium]|nr:MFS transporter [Pseudomonadales bacterium]